jgi:hypothetical protein
MIFLNPPDEQEDFFMSYFMLVGMIQRKGLSPRISDQINYERSNLDLSSFTDLITAVHH